MKRHARFDTTTVRLVIALALAVAAMACGATPYGPIARSGGYEVSTLGHSTYSVSFVGNQLSEPKTLAVYSWYRCAELALEVHEPYFLLAAPPTNHLGTVPYQPERENPDSFRYLSYNHIVRTFPDAESAARVAKENGVASPVVYDARAIEARLRPLIAR